VTTDDRPAAVTSDAASAQVSPERGSGKVGKADEKDPARTSLPVWQETLILLGIAVVLAIVIKALFVQAFYIPSVSMEPGLVKNDRILVQKWSYWFGGAPERGDVVVFDDPGGWLIEEGAGPANPLTKALAAIGLYPSGGHLVKRVIGVEGDVITCCDAEGRISVNGEPLDEDDYILVNEKACGNGPMRGNCDWTAGPVPEGHLFVMGDHRNQSADSTVHMCIEGQTDCVPGREFVDEDLVVGKVFFLAWPLGHARWVGDPDSFDDVPAPKSD
jgi:signal peptidase I